MDLEMRKRELKKTKVGKFKLRVRKEKELEIPNKSWKRKRVSKEHIWVFGDRVKFSSVKSEASFPRSLRVILNGFRLECDASGLPKGNSTVY